MKVVIASLFLLFFVICVQSQEFVLTQAQYVEAYNNYVSAYDKSYATPAEAEKSFNSFKANLDSSMQANAKLPDGSAFDSSVVESNVHQYFDETPAEFIASRAQAIPTEVVVAAVAGGAAALSTAAIVGIAVGGGAVVAASVAGAVVYHKRKSAQKEKVPSTAEMPTYKPQGIDILNILII